MDIYSIAIDGPAGSGKSTVAKELSDRLGIIYVDTGAMYRTVAYYCMKNGISTTDGKAVAEALDNIKMDISIEDGVQRMILNGEDVTGLIRSAEVGQGASDVGTFVPVRDRLVEMQQEMAKAQEELQNAELTGSAGGGLVEVRVNGKNEFLGISIKPEAVDPDDVEMLEDLIAAAMSDAKAKADELSREKLGAFGAMGGML